MRSQKYLKANMPCPKCGENIVFLVSDHPDFKESLILKLEKEVATLKKKLKQLQSPEK
jgi:transcription initiation factor IIE alpha subunit